MCVSPHYLWTLIHLQGPLCHPSPLSIWDVSGLSLLPLSLHFSPQGPQSHRPSSAWGPQKSLDFVLSASENAKSGIYLIESHVFLILWFQKRGLFPVVQFFSVPTPHLLLLFSRSARTPHGHQIYSLQVQPPIPATLLLVCFAPGRLPSSAHQKPRLTLIQIDDLQALLDTLWLWSNLLHSLDDQGWPSFPCSYSRSFLIICERQLRSFFLCAGEVSRLTNSFTEKLEIGSLPFFSPPCVSVYCCLFLPFTILFPAWLAHCCLLVPPRTFFSVIFISSYLSWVFAYLLPSAPSLLFPCTAHLTLSAFYWPASERLVCCWFYFSFNQLQLDRGFPTLVQLILHAATSFQPPSCLPAFDTVNLFFGLHGTAVLIFLLILRLSFLCLLHWVLFCHSFFKYNQSFRVPCSAFFPCYPDLGMNSSNPMTYFLRTVC